MSNLNPKLAQEAHEDVGGSPSAEERNFYPLDRRLREVGYEIHARPREGPVLWQRKKDRKVFTEEAALAVLARLCREKQS